MTRKLAPADLPSWPRLLAVDMAAAYASLSPGAFESRVGAGDFPQPIRVGARKLWDKAAIDTAIDKLNGRTRDKPSDAINPQPDTIRQRMAAARQSRKRTS